MLSKYLKQFIIYLLEIFVVVCSFLYITNKLTPFCTTYEIIERIFTGVVLYQGFVFLINENTLDTKKDMIMAYKTHLKYCKLYVETDSTDVLNIIKDNYESLNNKKVFIRKEYLDGMKMTNELIENNYIGKAQKLINIKAEEIQAEHNYESCDLKWRYSIILRLLK